MKNRLTVLDTVSGKKFKAVQALFIYDKSKNKWFIYWDGSGRGQMPKWVEGDLSRFEVQDADI